MSTPESQIKIARRQAAVEKARIESIVSDVRLYAKLHNAAMTRLVTACDEFGWTLLDDKVTPNPANHPICARDADDRIEVLL